MTAPVSLAEVRAWVGKGKELDPCSSALCSVTTCVRSRAVLALVELAEAYLAVRDGAGLTGSEYLDARKRLALAAKQVRP